MTSVRATPVLADNEAETANLFVAVRLRPFTQDEKNGGATQVVYKVDDQMCVIMDPGDNLDDVLRQNRSRERRFLLDRTFAPDATQEEVYAATAKHLIDTVISGYCGTVFAYGPTGTGKTYTMLGTAESPGIMYRALDDLFQQMQRTQETMRYEVKMSYLEIYNELLRDLLTPSSMYLDLREDNRGGMQVAGLSEISATSSSQVMQLLIQGNRRRTQEPTAANKTSSRSHAILQVSVVQRDRIPNAKEQRRLGKLFLIDLAGSERAASTQNTGMRMKEGAHINRSLLALGNVINTLTEKGAKYVNYRDSKLTRLLKDSLGGNSRTVMITNVSPASIHFEETRNTLVYAERARGIRAKVTRTTADVTHHLTQYQSIISELRKEIARLQTKIDEPPQMRLDARLHSPPTGLKLPVVRPVNTGEDRKEFNKLRDELMASFDKQMSFRKQLTEYNDRAYELAVQLSKREAVLDLWERRPTLETEAEGASTPRKYAGNFMHGDEPDKIRVTREEAVVLRDKLHEIERHKETIERELSTSLKEAQKIEDTLPKKITSEDQRVLLTIMARLREAEIDKVLAETDEILTSRRVSEKESAIRTMQKYGLIADRLISEQNNLIKAAAIPVPVTVDNMLNDYRTVKSFIQLDTIPVDPKTKDLAAKSWNRRFIEKEREEKESKMFSRTLNYNELRRMKSELEQKQHRSSIDSEVDLMVQARLPKVPSGKSSVDDSAVNYTSEEEPLQSAAVSVPILTLPHDDHHASPPHVVSFKDDYRLDVERKNVRSSRKSRTPSPRRRMSMTKIPPKPHTQQSGLSRVRSLSRVYDRPGQVKSGTTKIPYIPRNPNRRIASPSAPKLPFIEHTDTNSNFVTRKH